MLIGLTGKLAAWKGQVIKFLQQKGYQHITFSNLIKEEVLVRGLELSRYNLNQIWTEIRNKEWQGAWATRIINMIDPEQDYVLDGIRTLGEIQELRKFWKFVLIGIDADERLRYERVVSRQRETDQKTWEWFLEMDKLDLAAEDPNGTQVLKCMAVADFTVINNSTIEEFRNKIEYIYQQIS